MIKQGDQPGGVSLPMARKAEQAKYQSIYDSMPNYRMGDVRKVDARQDLTEAFAAGCKYYLDVGCGRGEMLEYARHLGFYAAVGTEVVPALCQSDTVEHAFVHELQNLFMHRTFHLVSSFDVLEHLLPGDDEILVRAAGALATKMIVLTANNQPSVDPATGNDLHINIKTYEQWDADIRRWLPDWQVARKTGRLYVSETWHATPLADSAT